MKRFFLVLVALFALCVFTPRVEAEVGSAGAECVSCHIDKADITQISAESMVVGSTTTPEQPYSLNASFESLSSRPPGRELVPASCIAKTKRTVRGYVVSVKNRFSDSLKL